MSSSQLSLDFKEEIRTKNTNLESWQCINSTEKQVLWWDYLWNENNFKHSKIKRLETKKEQSMREKAKKSVQI